MSTNLLKKGFTLIELLIVIAIIGILAVVILLAIDPLEQLARTRDAGRYSGVTQLGHAVEAYAVNNDSVYPTEVAAPVSWIRQMVDSAEIKTEPGAIAYQDAALICSNVMVNNWCYDMDLAADPDAAVVYSRLESRAQRNRCPVPATDLAFAVYSTADARGGLVCLGAGEPLAGTQVFQ